MVFQSRRDERTGQGGNLTLAAVKMVRFAFSHSLVIRFFLRSLQGDDANKQNFE